MKSSSSSMSPISWAQPCGTSTWLSSAAPPKIKEPQIDAAAGSRLKLIIRAGVGVDNIAVKYAEEHGIQVKNTPRASSNAVAELALALLFSCARNISIAGHTMRENKWEKKAYSKGL